MHTLLSCLAISAAFLPARALAQDAEATEPALFVSAQRLIIAPGEVLEPGQVIIRDGLIVAVGQDLEAPEGATLVSGEVVCSGFIDPWSALGLDSASQGNSKVNMASRAVDALDIFNGANLRQEALGAGVTTVRSQLARGGQKSGIGAVLKLAGDSRESAVLLAEGAAGASIGLSQQGRGRFVQDASGTFQLVSGAQAVDPFDRLSQVDRLASSLEGGRTYSQSLIEYRYDLEEWEEDIAEKEKELDKGFKKAKKARKKDQDKAEKDDKEFKENKYKEDKKPKAPKFDSEKEAFGRIVNGEIPLIVQVHRVAEIRELLKATERFNRLRLIIAGGTEAMSCAEELASRQVSVVVWPTLLDQSGKQGYDEFDGHKLTLAGRLAAAGVPVLLGSGGQSPRATRDLPLLAALAIGHGFDRDKAFAAMTLKAAEALDVADRVGSLAFGKDADLQVLDGEPLVSTTRVQYVIADGTIVVSPEN